MKSCLLGPECSTPDGGSCKERGCDYFGANASQVGGAHYKTSYEHWDLVIKVYMGYFEGQATKYAMRWRKKSGLQDLQKALHFLDKLTENANVFMQDRCERNWNVLLARYREEMIACSRANGLLGLEFEFCWRLISWQNLDDLAAARMTLLQLIKFAEASPLAKAVPLEDSNKHGDRGCDSAGWPNIIGDGDR